MIDLHKLGFDLREKVPIVRWEAHKQTRTRIGYLSVAVFGGQDPDRSGSIRGT